MCTFLSSEKGRTVATMHYYEMQQMSVKSIVLKKEMMCRLVSGTVYDCDDMQCSTLICACNIKRILGSQVLIPERGCCHHYLVFLPISSNFYLVIVLKTG